MVAGDPPFYWPQVYDNGKIRITRSPNNDYFFLEEGIKFIFSAPQKKLQEIAVSDNSKSCELVNTIFKKFSLERKITIQEIVEVIKVANWNKAFD